MAVAIYKIQPLHLLGSLGGAVLNREKKIRKKKTEKTNWLCVTDENVFFITSFYEYNYEKLRREKFNWKSITLIKRCEFLD